MNIWNSLLAVFFNSSVRDNLIANFLWWVILGIITIVYLNFTNRLYPIVHKFFGKKIARIFRVAIFIIVHPILRILILLLLLGYLNTEGNHLLVSFTIFLVSISFFLRPGKKVSFDPIPDFSDDFSDLNTLSKNWEIKSGNPQIETDFGKPKPDILLKHVGNQATNSFIILKKIKTQLGIIECDFYLEPGSLFNMVFLCNSQNHNWYMARYESRSQNSDGILIKDQGPGNNWGELVMSGTRTTPGEWHRARIEFDKEKITMYRDGVLIVEAKQPRILGDEIGIFNECADVHVDNLSFIEKNEK